MKIEFHGADRTVTGSCHLIECAGQRVVIDCGLAQGGREADARNRANLAFDPARIDAVLLTHAHADHCGRLPLLYKRGFTGRIFCTAATAELARVVLLDSAHLQEEDALRHAARPGVVPGRAAQALYTLADAQHCANHFDPSAVYGTAHELAPGIRVTFFEAGHILGSASLFVELEEEGRRRTVAFSGDLGNLGRPLLAPPVLPPRADVAVLETTYGDRQHKPIDASVEELYHAVAATLARGGNVVIPTFALERAQEILWYLRQGWHEGRLQGLEHVFLDSPMAISATEIFARHVECLQPAIARQIRAGTDPFQLPGIAFTRAAADSRTINRFTCGTVILAGAGMCNGGRVLYHLQRNLPRPECAVIFVGFAARGTLARRIIDGVRRVRILQEDVAVRAAIHTINGFSAHADQRELLAWHRRVHPGLTFLVHGEEAAMQALAPLLRGGRVEMPAQGQVFEI